MVDYVFDIFFLAFDRDFYWPETQSTAGTRGFLRLFLPSGYSVETNVDKRPNDWIPKTTSQIPQSINGSGIFYHLFVNQLIGILFNDAVHSFSEI